MTWGWQWYPTGTEGVDISRNTYDDETELRGTAVTTIEMPTTIKLILLTENTCPGLMRLM